MIKRAVACLVGFMVLSVAAESRLDSGISAVRQKYKDFMKNIKQIKKCYFHPSACTQQEQEDAQKAAKEIGKKGAVIAALCTTLYVSSITFKSKSKKIKVKEAFQRHFRINLSMNAIEFRGNTVVVTLPAYDVLRLQERVWAPEWEKITDSLRKNGGMDAVVVRQEQFFVTAPEY